MNKVEKKIFSLSNLTVSVGKISIFLYLPAFPIIGLDLHLSREMLANTLAIFMIALGISQLFYGPFADSYGRKKAFIIACLFMLAGLYLSAISTSDFALLFSRALQGIGAGAFSLIPRIILKDIFKKSKMSMMISRFLIIGTIITAITPLLGGIILNFFTWREMFLILFIYVFIIMLVIIFFLPETKRKNSLISFKISKICKNYISLFRKKIYIKYVCGLAFGYSLIAGYYAVTPFIFQVDMHINALNYGILMIFPAIFYSIGNFVAGKLKTNSSKMIIYGILICIIFSLGISFQNFLNIHGPIIVLIFIVGVSFGSGLIISKSMTKMLLQFPKMIGTAGAVGGFFQMMAASFIIFIIGIFKLTNSFKLGITLFGASFILFIILVFIKDN